MEFSHPDFTIIETLGHGASGSVYLAVQNKLNRRVAVKLINDLYAATGAQRFLREARILAQLDHPNIVSVHELVELQDRTGYLMVMAFVDGGTLRQRADQLSLREALTTIQQIGHALGYAHRQGFIHRDVKPDNILFQDNDAMLADFGIARLADSQTHMTQHGSLLGTPVYMSPEQVNGSAIDARSDLYSLAIVLFELLAGAPPYKAESAIATGIQHLTLETPVLPSVFSCFQPFIERALAKEKNQRPANSNAFLTELTDATMRFQWPLDERISSLRAMAETSHSRQVKSTSSTKVTAVRAVSIMGIVLVAGWFFVVQRHLLLGSVEGVTSTPSTTAGSAPEMSQRLQSNTTPASDNTQTQRSARQQTATAENAPAVTPATQSVSVDALLSEADALKRANNWYGIGVSALSLYRQVLTTAPDNQTALEALRQITADTRRLTEQQIASKQWEQATATLSALEKHWPDYPELASLKQQYLQAFEQEQARQQQLAEERTAQQQKARRIKALIDRAIAAENENRLLEPNDNSALSFYRAVLAEDPRNTISLQGLHRVKQSQIQRTSALIDNGEFTVAERLISSLQSAFPDDTAFTPLVLELSLQKEKAERLTQRQQQQRQLKAAINTLNDDVAHWLQQSDDTALTSYPSLAQRLNSLLQQVPQDESLIQLKERSRAHFEKLSLEQTQSEDDVFRMPGF